MFYLYQIFYKLSLNLSKLSILTLYLRVFDTKDWFGKITKFLIFLVLSYTASIIIANIFICDPISTYWNTSLPDDASRKGSKCINILGYWYASSLYVSSTIIFETLLTVQGITFSARHSCSFPFSSASGHYPATLNLLSCNSDKRSI